MGYTQLTLLLITISLQVRAYLDLLHVNNVIDFYIGIASFYNRFELENVKPTPMQAHQ